MFGQTTVAPVAVIENPVEVVNVKNDIATIDTQIDFVGWFMGSKQSQINEGEISGSSNTAVTKKQILTSGIIPNKVLYRTFMKRVISQDSGIA